MKVVWAPFPGRQTEFLEAAEFDVLFGGAKGPGKSDCILAGATRQVDLDRYKALILRATWGELTELIDRSHRMFPSLEQRPRWNGELKRWVFPLPASKLGAAGAYIQFGYCDEPKDVEIYQGREWSYVGFDELGNVRDERTIDRLLSEIRSPNPDIVLMFRASANPGGRGHGIIKRRYIDPCGEDGGRRLVRRITIPGRGTVETVRRFIPARVQDNPVYANDASYMAMLMTLPETLRDQLLFGRWDVGLGLALDELNEHVHLVPPFPVPAHWYQFGSYDWGYAHWWVFVWWAVDEDGRCFVVDTVRGRRELVPEQANRLKEAMPLDRLDVIFAGHDVFAENRSRQVDGTPSIAEEFADWGVHRFLPANTARRLGLQNARHYIAYKGLLGSGVDDDPWCLFFDTPGNRWLFQQLQAMVTDEADPEVVLKVNADPLTGEGGDDGYDAWRFGLASRPPRAIGLFREREIRAWDPVVLKAEHERHYRVQERKLLPAGEPGAGEPEPSHAEPIG